jgi:hypothetical protein
VTARARAAMMAAARRIGGLLGRVRGVSVDGAGGEPTEAAVTG